MPKMLHMVFLKYSSFNHSQLLIICTDGEEFDRLNEVDQSK